MATKGTVLPSFADFGLDASILRAVAAEGYTTPTPIQVQAIPKVLAGRDLCGIAQTGTGKTAAFALPILHRLRRATGKIPPRGCRALVLAPTRELASQIAERFHAYGQVLPLSTAVVFGGVPIAPQQRQLAPGVDILVSTPGRLLDLIDRHALVLSSVEILVLDEADRMLDLGFIHALTRVVRLLPQQRQTLLFSATMPKAIAELAKDYLDDPVNVSVTPVATTAERVDQGVMLVPSERKRDLLVSLLRDPALNRVLVFTRTKQGADRLVRHLGAAGLEASAIHGNKSQPQRERALAGFREGRTRILVATDIAARGIDVEGVSHVVNFEMPNVPEDYVHRIGRTARAGAAGIAIAFCSDEERPHLRDIEKLTRSPLRLIPAPAGFAHSPPVAQPIAAKRPKKDVQRASRSRRAQETRPPRQMVERQDIQREEAVRIGSFPAFVRRPPARKTDQGLRRLDRRPASATAVDRR
jgi:ATP-dependent RNA helicase RhlE